MSERIYVVSDNDDNDPRLVRANNQAQAIAHVTRNRFTAKVASQDDLVAMLNDGIDVENARGNDVGAADPA